MVEHLFCKQAVAGSNPIAGSIPPLPGAPDGTATPLPNSYFRFPPKIAD
jgi:hypothetical protein